MLAAMATDLVLTVASSVLLPHFSQLIAKRSFDGLRERVSASVGGYIFFMMPITVLFLFASRPVVDLLYSRGRFGPDAAAITAVLITIVALADPFFGAGQILVQVHISNGNTMTPMKIGFWRIGVKLLLSVLLIRPLGVYGLATASSLSTVFRTVEIWRRLPDHLRPSGRRIFFHLRDLVPPVALAGAAAFTLARFGPRFSGHFAGQLGRVATIAAASGTLYLATAALLRNPYAHGLLERLRARSGAPNRPPSSAG